MTELRVGMAELKLRASQLPQADFEDGLTSNFQMLRTDVKTLLEGTA